MVEETAPIPRLDWADFGLELQVDRIETSLLCEGDQVALVEVEHGIRIGRLDRVVHGADLP